MWDFSLSSLPKMSECVLCFFVVLCSILSPFVSRLEGFADLFACLLVSRSMSIDLFFFFFFFRGGWDEYFTFPLPKGLVSWRIYSKGKVGLV